MYVKHSSFLPVLLFLAACSGGGGGRTVEVRIDGAAGRKLYFDRFVNGQPQHVDSVTLDAEGRGSMRIPPLPLDFYRVTLDGKDQTVLALDSTDQVTVVARAGSMLEAEQITGSPASEALHAFYRTARGHEIERDSLRQLLAAGSQDQGTIDRFNEVNKTYYEYCKQVAGERSGEPAGLAAVSKLNIQNELALFIQVRDAMRKTMPRSDFFGSFREQVDRAEQMAASQKAQEEEMKRLSNLLPVGAEAPEIRQQTPDGGTLALSQLRGKVVLIDFWASWCRPCRMENPHVKKVYEKYSRKGFEILGVSLDRDHNAWVGAIKQDGLPWKHVSDLGFWNNAAAQEYGVNSIPFTVLLDREGKVIDKNLRGAALDARLAQIFGS
ncbi:MAG: AhpC/TSA family protein [Flavobacteriales bacterium]|nr:AhpC/TSA family protein [Flavobacteriales bacterium]